MRTLFIIASAKNIAIDCKELLAEDKVRKIPALEKNGKIISFVGDGVNDAPVGVLFGKT